MPRSRYWGVVGGCKNSGDIRHQCSQKHARWTTKIPVMSVVKLYVLEQFNKRISVVPTILPQMGLQLLPQIRWQADVEPPEPRKRLLGAILSL